jgi:hypothetical protein
MIIPYIPTDSPKLSHLVYEMILGHFLAHDREVCHPTNPIDNDLNFVAIGFIANYPQVAEDNLRYLSHYRCRASRS